MKNIVYVIWKIPLVNKESNSKVGKEKITSDLSSVPLYK
jgi:hypothetical protein